MITFDGLTPLFIPPPHIDWVMVAYFEIITAILESLIFYWYASSRMKVTPKRLVVVCVLANLASFSIGVFLQYVPWLLTASPYGVAIMYVVIIGLAILGTIIHHILPNDAKEVKHVDQ